MATQGPAAPEGPPQPGRPLTPAQMEQLIAAEAKNRGMTVEQFKQFQQAQQKALAEEAAKHGMSPQQFIQMQQQKLVEEAKSLGISPQELIQRKQQEAMQAQQQQAAQGGNPPQPGQAPGAPQQQMQRIDLNKPVEPKPEALAVAKFLRNQDLKTRTCIFDGQRKDMFKVKRAFRALNSDAYKKARTKDPLLPQVTNDAEARTALQLLPLNMLALRVVKHDPHEGHNHGPKKRIKGLWTVKIEGQQDFDPMMHYMWIYEAPSIKTKVYSVLALIAVFTVVLFPLWPMKMRQGVWYLSVGMMGLLGAFFAMSIFRLILFCVTVFTVPPGLWLFPNLFEDVGFFDSFKPVWGWQETKKGKKKSKRTLSLSNAEKPAEKVGQDVPTANVNGGATTSGVDSSAVEGVPVPTKRHVAPTVEEADDD